MLKSMRPHEERGDVRARERPQPEDRERHERRDVPVLPGGEGAEQERRTPAKSEIVCHEAQPKSLACVIV